MAFQVEKTKVRGRFAPTPSGPLHLGSLLTALASWLQARAHDGVWLLRIDDLDGPRCPPGAADELMRQLESHGLTWDESPRYQSRHVDEYETACVNLERAGLTFRCACTRAQLAAASLAGPDGPVYAGTCLSRRPGAGRPALRARLGTGRISLEDCWGEPVSREVATDIGDIIVRRADGQVAYQLACVVDEDAQRINEVIRGADLLGSSCQQVALRRLTGHRSPRYGHLPVLADAQGRKFSKQNHAEPIRGANAGHNLSTCLALLGMPPPPDFDRGKPDALLEWVLPAWRAAKPPRAAQSGAFITYNAVQQTGFSK